MGSFLCCEEQHERKRSEKKIMPAQENLVVKTAQPIAELYKQEQGRSESKLVSPTSPKRGPQNYQSIKYLGRGAFGNVVLAEDKQTSKQYAMKVIDKSKIKEFNVLQCKLIQQIHNKHFLVAIRETFQNQNNIYIIMEYLPKGDLYFYLKKKEVKFSEEIIMGLVAEIIIGVEFLHRAGIIYRELKPENIMVTNDGHIKLTDYGLSKVIIQNKLAISTFVGTLQYMAPQALKGQFGQKVDIWAIGVLMFELMFELSPFEDEKHVQFSTAEFQSRIEKINIQETLNRYIGHVSLNFRDLIRGLLQKNPEKRLSLQQMRHHAFFKTVNWEDVSERRTDGPLRPFVENNDHIKFRDPTNEQYIRRKYTRKGSSSKESYQINLFEFLNSH